jgi:hypothetical protein
MLVTGVRYILVDEEEEQVSTIDVPVRLVIEVEEQEKFVADVLRTDGALRVSMCAVCFSLVPTGKLFDHGARHAQ